MLLLGVEQQFSLDRYTDSLYRKSRIAIEYCHRHRSQSPDDHVFWVHCGNAARFGLIYQDIARTLELPGFDDPKTNTVHLVSEWLSNESNGSWLMVLDNANDATIWIRSDNERESQQIHQEQAVPLAEYVPRGKHGRVLITTRDSQLGKALANSKKKPIEIAPLRPEDAETLLRRKIPEDDQVTEGDAAEITKTLDYLPLAITQAAAYLDKMDMAVAEYLDLLKMGKAGSFDLLRPDAHDPGRDYEIQNSVFSTWKISFDLISRQAPRAAGLLSLMAMFDRQAILDSLLRLDGESELDFIAAIQKLKAFSLITEETKASIFSMHPSVQLSIQKWLEHLGELSKWQEVSLSALANCCPPSGEYEHWGSVEALYPHFELILKHPLDSDISQLKRATILHVLGCYKNARGQHSVAYTYCSESRITRERLLGVTHAETLISVNEQAITLGNIGQNEEAEVVFRRVFDVRKEALGPIHQQTMISMNNLANSMLRNGRHREVRAMLEQVLDTGRGTVDAEDPNTLTSISLLAMCLSKNRCYGCHTKAGVMLRQVFIISSKVLPPLHPYTLDSMSDLAGFLASYGFYQEHAFVMRKKGRGLKLPNTLPDISASEFRKKRRGEIRQAESMYRTVLTGQEIKLGVDHMATLETVHGLADVLDSLHCFEEASALYQRGVLGFTNTLGSEHDATKRCLNCQMRMLAHMERGCAWQDGDCQDGGSQDGDSQDGDSQDGYSQDGGSQDEDIQNEESQYDAKTKGASLGQISELGQTGTSRSQSRSHYFASADGEYNIISLDTATNREESSAESIDHYALLEKPQPIDASQSQTPFCRSESDLQHPSHPMATVRRLSSPS